MLGTFFLGVLAGTGGAAILQRRRAAGGVIIAVTAMVIVAEGIASEVVRTVPVPSKIYEVTRTLRPGAAVAGVSFGVTYNELRNTDLSGFGRQPELNGVSCCLPLAWRRLKVRFRKLPSGG